MGYTSFLTLMREDSKFAHRKYMAKVLRESPGLLILDEGHNPRSTKSRLRKALMKVGTDLRILLSGTLFQNNFCEYFNTLCLARPKFIHEVLMELDQKFKTNQGVNKARHLLENKARKFFLDIIANKIDASVGEERLQGLNMLKNMTNSFIDNYEGSGSGSGDALPGLQIYTLLMNSTDVQHKILTKLQDVIKTYFGYPLEVELQITLAAIHHLYLPLVSGLCQMWPTLRIKYKATEAATYSLHLCHTLFINMRCSFLEQSQNHNFVFIHDLSSPNQQKRTTSQKKASVDSWSLKLFEI